MLRCTTDIDCSPGMICDGSKSYCRLKSDNTDGTLCAGIICREGEGGCRSDSECDGSLVCGTDNCAIGTPGMACCSGDGNVYLKKLLKHIGQIITERLLDIIIQIL